MDTVHRPDQVVTQDMVLRQAKDTRRASLTTEEHLPQEEANTERLPQETKWEDTLRRRVTSEGTTQAMARPLEPTDTSRPREHTATTELLRADTGVILHMAPLKVQCSLLLPRTPSTTRGTPSTTDVSTNGKWARCTLGSCRSTRTVRDPSLPLSSPR